MLKEYVDVIFFKEFNLPNSYTIETKIQKNPAQIKFEILPNFYIIDDALDIKDCLHQENISSSISKNREIHKHWKNGQQVLGKRLIYYYDIQNITCNSSGF